ncbi:hypothetical protein SRHO_G00286340 [Serrasalmus rhombeus]
MLSSVFLCVVEVPVVECAGSMDYPVHRGDTMSMGLHDRWCNPGYVTVKEIICSRDIELMAISTAPACPAVTSTPSLFSAPGASVSVCLDINT